MTQTEAPNAFQQLVGDSPAVEQLGTGFMFTEGPIWNPESKELFFSDMPGDTRRRWTATDGCVDIRQPSNKCNGMAYDANGNLLVCEHATSRLIREERDGSTTVLASHWQGKELNSPNDVIVALNGDIYFSDPIFGRVPVFGVERDQDLDFQGVYRIAAGTTELQLIADDFDQPNGLCMSPDESILYVNDSPRAHIRQFPVGADGAYGSGEMFFEGIGNGVVEDGIPDGMKCDTAGNIWVTGPEGVWVIDSTGRHLGTVPVPENVGNINWGGDDWSTLFIAASTSLYRLQTNATAAPVPNTRRAG